jgi:dolichol-phosphate mannosyltransferase
MGDKKIISIVTPCFNERDNISELYSRISIVIDGLKEFEWEILFIDNCSKDGTVEILRKIAKEDRRVKVILNTRNFGHIRSPYWGIMQSHGDATVYLASDLQDPPEMIAEFLEQWLKGYKIVMGVKPTVKSNHTTHFFRKLYYKLLDSISEVPIIRNATGFGLYDRKVIEEITAINDPYPFLRGLICELGYEIKTIVFKQPERVKGLTKNNFYSIYDIGMLGLVSHSKVLLRLSTLFGFLSAFISIVLGILYITIKILNWNIFMAGIAPLIVSIFFLFGILFGILGVIGEYILVIYTHVNNRPIVVEKERINF